MKVDWGTVAPERLDGINITPPPRSPPIKFNYFQMEVIMSKGPLWMSLWKHELAKDMELYLWQCCLVDTLRLIEFKYLCTKGDNNVEKT